MTYIFIESARDRESRPDKPVSTRGLPIRPFTEKERQSIDQDLKAAGRRLFTELGWKKTGIDDLCRAAGIARGTFYRFYPSKDAFFLQLLTDAEAAIKAEVVAALAATDTGGRTLLEGFLQTSATVVDRHPMLRFAFSDTQEPAPWMRTLDEASMNRLTEGDDTTASDVLGLLRSRGLALQISPSVFAGLLRALVLLPLSRRTIGLEVYEEVSTTLTSALARGLL